MIYQIILAFFLFPGIGNSVSTCEHAAGDFHQRDSITFYDGQNFDIIGKYHGEKNYVRFPQQYKNTLRENVWNLGQNSAGVAIRFRTNASTIIVRWTVMNESNLLHMPATGVRGVDLYTYSNSQWQYIRTGFPAKKTNEYEMLSKGDGISREYLLNLPLYDGVESVEIGVNASAEISPAKERFLLDSKPVVYYGTSIAQGGCASRPGLAFTNILSRQLNRAFINFGFSGNGTIETSVGAAMCEVDAALYVIDCNPNTQVELIYDRTLELVGLLKKRRADIPVLLVGGFRNESFHFNPSSGVNENVEKKEKELKRAFETLKKSGVAKLYYQTGYGLIGSDHEGTVDGIHPNDVGMMRIAEGLLPMIKKIL
ncbi:MAG: SGNH/GDSL hydrolase family protein [Cyclobacteriaceae bacterium]